MDELYMDGRLCIQYAAYKYTDLVLKRRSVSQGLHTSCQLLQPCTEPQPQTLQIETLTVCLGRRHSGVSDSGGK